MTDLPAFRYHPDPLASGSIIASDATCACCDERRGFIYTGPAYCEAELVFVVPKRGGGDAEHRWLYTADIYRLPDGDCSTVDLDKVYEAGPDGRFTRLIGRNAAGPNFDGLVDGWRISSAGYRMNGYMLSRRATADGGTSWHLALGLMRRPKPVLVK